MTNSPAFAAALHEEQMLAEQRLRSAEALGDESGVLEARNRLADLAEIIRRNAAEPVQVLDL
jgi:hypothetical protein